LAILPSHSATWRGCGRSGDRDDDVGGGIADDVDDRRLLRLQHRAAVALDRPAVAGVEHVVGEVAVLGDPHLAAGDADRAAAGVVEVEKLVRLERDATGRMGHCHSPGSWLQSRPRAAFRPGFGAVFLKPWAKSSAGRRGHKRRIGMPSMRTDHA
jgi:hypothetical protein